MLLVTGATGHLGSAVVSQLLKKTKPSEISVLARDENKASALRTNGIDVRIGSYDDISSLDKAMQGIPKLLLISGNGPNRLQQHKNVVNSAKKAGVAHIVYTSISIKNMKTAAIRPIMESISQTEDIIKESGLQYTILRHTLYTGGTPLFGGEKILKTGIFLPTGDGKVPFALRREMGEAAANVLLQNGHENKTYEITGTMLHSYEDVARELSALSGQTVRYTDADPSVFATKIKDFGLPEIVNQIVEGFSADVKNHQFEKVTKDLENLLGRKPATLNASLKEIFNL
ncbi:MAG TPA: SDR family oxidoreductase [Puia sp.]|nr:SDR family oxidoreductase [Puia sp.]